MDVSPNDIHQENEAVAKWFLPYSVIFAVFVSMAYRIRCQQTSNYCILSVEYAKNIKKQRVACRSPAPTMSTAMAFEPTFKAK
jgi:hypothetical protein